QTHVSCRGMIAAEAADDVSDLLHRSGRSRRYGRSPGFEDLSDMPDAGSIEPSEKSALEVIQGQSRIRLEKRIPDLKRSIRQAVFRARAVECQGVGVIDSFRRIARFQYRFFQQGDSQLD